MKLTKNLALVSVQYSRNYIILSNAESAELAKKSASRKSDLDFAILLVRTRSHKNEITCAG